MNNKPLKNLTICIKSGGDLATGVAARLYKAGLKRLILLETERPLAVRRNVSYAEAVYHGIQTVEGITARLCCSAEQFEDVFAAGEIAIIVDPQWSTLQQISPDVVVDAILAKRNIGTTMAEAPLVIGLGPGFDAGKDVHCIIETNRGHFLGSTIYSGPAQPNTGAPGMIAGYTVERVLWSPTAGTFKTDHQIGDMIKQGEPFGFVDELPIPSKLDGVIRGLLRSETPVQEGTKLGDVDPRGEVAYCSLVSEKSRAIGGGVLEAILHNYL
ncbi:MAG: selenium-dependent molybdenum cofactor biosynthesis protein YqeB [Desulfuromusa sp.]